MGWRTITSNKEVEVESESKTIEFSNLYIGNYKKNFDDLSDTTNIGAYYDKEKLDFKYMYSNTGVEYGDSYAFDPWISVNIPNQLPPIAGQTSRKILINVNENKFATDRYCRIYLKNKNGEFPYYILVKQKKPVESNEIQYEFWFKFDATTFSRYNFLLFGVPYVTKYFSNNIDSTLEEIYILQLDEYPDALYIISKEDENLALAHQYMYTLGRGYDTDGILDFNYSNIPNLDKHNIHICLLWDKDDPSHKFLNKAIPDNRKIYQNNVLVPATYNNVMRPNVIANINENNLTKSTFAYTTNGDISPDITRVLSLKLSVLVGTLNSDDVTTQKQTVSLSAITLNMNCYIGETKNDKNNNMQNGTSEHPYILYK